MLSTSIPTEAPQFVQRTNTVQSNKVWRVALMILSLVLSSCQGDLRELCTWVGICDPIPAPPETISVLCDYSTGATCSSSTLDSTIAFAVTHILQKPGSRIELWMLGGDIASTQSVANFVIGKSPKNGVHAIQRFQEKQLDSARVFFLRKADDFLRSGAPLQSPLAAGIGKISLNTVTTSEAWHVVVISDALEYGEGWDFECNPPLDQRFTKAIQDRGFFTATSLSKASVGFAFVTLGRIDGNRCVVEMERVRRIRNLWTSALSAAGAQKVSFSAGLPQLEGVEP